MGIPGEVNELVCEVALLVQALQTGESDDKVRMPRVHRECGDHRDSHQQNVEMTPHLKFKFKFKINSNAKAKAKAKAEAKAKAK